MLEIKRNGLIITPNGSLDASAGSYDVPVTLTNDDTYSDYVINMFVGWYAKGVLKKRKAEIDSDGNYLIPKEAFQQKGMINISFLLEKIDKSQGLMTNALSYQVKNAPNVIIEVPADPTWEEIVREWCAELINATIPIISVSKKDGVTTLNITDINGTKTVLIEDGYIPVKGVDYTDGISPIVSVTPITEGSGGYKISITDANGTKTIDILNGSDGSDANVTDENIKKALGFTPAKQEDVNKLSDEKVNKNAITLDQHTDGLIYIFVDGVPKGNGIELNTGSIIEGDVIGTLDESNNILLQGNLADGTYTLKYENEDGTYTDIGSLVVGAIEEPEEEMVNQIPISVHADGSKGIKTNTRLSASSGGETSTDGYECTGFIPTKLGDVLEVKDIDLTQENATNIIFYDSSKNPIKCNGNNHGTALYIFFNISKGNGVYAGTIGNTSALTFTTDVAYIRIGSKSITSDSILTVNQEIV